MPARSHSPDSLDNAPLERELRIAGMYCSACGIGIEHALCSLPQVTSAQVNVTCGIALVRLSEEVDNDALFRAVRRAGYRPLGQLSAQDMLDDANRQRRRIGLNALVAMLLTVPIMFIEMGRHLVPALDFWLMFTPNAYWQTAVVMSVITLLILVGPGLGFYRRGVPALWRGHPSMDSLVMLGATAAWGYSTLVLWVPALLPANSQLLYFESAAVIVSLVLFGRYLEARASGLASRAMATLLALKPEQVLRIEADGTRQVAPSAIRKGDHLRVLPGQRLAVDGVLLSPYACLDQSMITGESMPVSFEQGQALVSGSINLGSSVEYEATHVGEQSTLARIIQMVQRAQASRLPIQSLADRVTERFVPLVLMVAILSLAGWLWLAPEETAWLMGIVGAISVLVISCPCAMGLATPVSVVVASGVAARLGVLFQRGEALQALNDVDYVVFDKTGTLTQGQPVVSQLINWAGQPNENLRLVASLEQYSEHPLGQAVVEHALSHSMPLVKACNVTNHPGIGISGQVAGHTVISGNRQAMLAEGISVQDAEGTAEALMGQGYTIVHVAVDGELVLMIAVGDPLMVTAARTLVALKQRQRHVMLLSGDASVTVSSIARQLGIDNFQGGMTPEGKSAAIEQLQAQGHRVAFVGDGINDAPALAQANVGIAVGRGTDIAMESADIILSSNEPGSLVNTIDLCRHTLANIRQNLVWAFAYNILCIPLAAGVYYALLDWMLSPEAAAFVMVLSSLCVMGNALRLQHFTPGFTGRASLPGVASNVHLFQWAQVVGTTIEQARRWLNDCGVTVDVDKALPVQAVNQLCCLHMGAQEGLDTHRLAASLKCCNSDGHSGQVAARDSSIIEQLAERMRRSRQELAVARALIDSVLSGPEGVATGEDGMTAPDHIPTTSRALLNHYTALGVLPDPVDEHTAVTRIRLAFLRQSRLANISLDDTQTLLKALAQRQPLTLALQESLLLHQEGLDARQQLLERAADYVKAIQQTSVGACHD